MLVYFHFDEEDYKTRNRFVSVLSMCLRVFVYVGLFPVASLICLQVLTFDSCANCVMIYTGINVKLSYFQIILWNSLFLHRFLFIILKNFIFSSCE